MRSTTLIAQPRSWLAACGVIGFALTSPALGADDDAAKPKPIDPAAHMPVPTTAEIDDSLAVGGEDIAARKLRSRMTVEVNVNGTGPYRFVVDSGADTSVIGTRIASALNLQHGGRVLLNGVTDSSMVDRVVVDEIELGPTAVQDLRLPVLKEYDIGAEGMIGLYHDNVMIYDMWGQGFQSGINSWSAVVKEWFGSLGNEKVKVEFENREVHEGEQIGFANALIIYQAMSIENAVIRSMKNRITVGFVKENGQWKVRHQHTSAPIDDKLQAILNL